MPVPTVAKTRLAPTATRASATRSSASSDVRCVQDDRFAVERRQGLERQKDLVAQLQMERRVCLAPRHFVVERHRLLRGRVARPDPFPDHPARDAVHPRRQPIGFAQAAEPAHDLQPDRLQDLLRRRSLPEHAERVPPQPRMPESDEFAPRRVLP